MPDLVIRRAGPEDAQALHLAIMALANHEHEEAFVLTTPDDLRAALAGSDPKAAVLIAMVGNGLVGYLSWVRVYSIWRAGDYLNLDDLYVSADVRGQGIGEALMRRFADIAIEQGLPARWEVMPGNAGARAFYGRLGATLREKLVVRWSVDAMAGGHA